MIQYGSPVNGMNRGVALGRASLQLGTKHTEANTITSLFGDQHQFLGLMNMWNQYNIVSTPILSQTELQANVIRTNGLGQTMSYVTKFKTVMPRLLDSDTGTQMNVGVNREKFGIVLDTNRYTKGDILTPAYRSGIQVQVCFDEEVEPYNDGWKYTVRVSSDDPADFVQRRFLVPGSEWVKIDHVKTEWSQENSAVTADSDGMEELMFKTGDTLSGLEHWITGHADMLEIKQKPEGVSMDLLAAADPKKVAVMYAFDTLGDVNDPTNPDRTKGAVAGSGKWMPMILELMNREAARMIEHKLMWSTGGVVYDARGTMARRGMGLYPQMKQGNYRTYTRTDQLLDILKSVTGDLFFGRWDIPMQDRRVKFEMGMGAMIEIQKAFAQEYRQNNPFAIMGDHPALKGYLTGDNMNLKVNGYRFVSYNFPEAGTVEIEHNPALDSVDLNTATSYYGRYPNSSYSILVKDLTDASFSNAMPDKSKYDVREGFNNGANIVLIKPKEFDEVRTTFEIGDYCPDMLRTYVAAPGKNAHISSSSFFGFKMKMFWAGEVWLKDPSRVVLIEREDPLDF